jgi:hypothetical protein
VREKRRIDEGHTEPSSIRRRAKTVSATGKLPEECLPSVPFPTPSLPSGIGAKANRKFTAAIHSFSSRIVAKVVGG